MAVTDCNYMSWFIIEPRRLQGVQRYGILLQISVIYIMQWLHVK